MSPVTNVTIHTHVMLLRLHALVLVINRFRTFEKPLKLSLCDFMSLFVMTYDTVVQG